MSVLSALDKANVPLIEMLVRDIETLDPAARINEWYRLLAFCYPKLKDIDVPPHLPAPAGAAGEIPPKPATPAERFAVIRGHFPDKPEASG